MGTILQPAPGPPGLSAAVPPGASAVSTYVAALAQNAKAYAVSWVEDLAAGVMQEVCVCPSSSSTSCTPDQVRSRNAGRRRPSTR